MKYRLKKSIPCAKAGEIFREDYDKNDNNNVYLYQESYGIKQHKICLEDIDNFDEWFEEVKKKKFGIYAAAAEIVEVSEELYTDSGIDNLNKLGAWFDTKEEAEKHLGFLKAKEVIKQDTKGFKPDWEDKNELKFFGYWKPEKEELDYGFQLLNQVSLVFFKTEEDIKESFKKHPEEWRTYLTYEQ